MKVTNVWVKKYNSGKLLGFADVQLSIDGGDEGQMIWKGFKLFQGKNGVQIGLPSKRDENGKVDDQKKPVYHPVITIPTSDDSPNPIGQEFLEHLRSEIETAYHKVTSEEKSGNKPKAKSASNVNKSNNTNRNHIDPEEVPF